MNDLNMHLSKTNFVQAGLGSPEADMQLWISFRAGSREALNIIFEKHVRLLFSYGRNITRDHALISDCIQDIFVDLWTRRASLSPEVVSIKFYLIKSIRRRILRRLAVDRRFLGHPIPADYNNEVEFHVEFNLIREEISSGHSHQLKNSIATLSVRQQEAIYLRFYQNLGYEEIASVMNTNVKAVYNLIAKSITFLRGFFKEHPIMSE
jgi:RNA polymerase sigma factor (sigma-70 family)